MDGVDPGIYERVANMKQQNPDLKVMIALGGWSFTDPGEWQNVFTSIVSNEGNRAQFITNLIGFLVGSFTSNVAIFGQRTYYK